MFRFLSGLFNGTGNLEIKNRFDFSSRPESAEVIRQNRELLTKVSDWIDAEAMKNSCFDYGVPPFIQDVINKDIGNNATYTDIMRYLAYKHFPQLNYLEIGVSVGKNFYQLAAGIPGGVFTGFDIEEINPVLERDYSLTNQRTWETKAGSIKKTASSFKEYDFRGTKVNYLCADVWDENSWSQLQGNKYNMVFSDALHTPEAILFEFEMLVKYKLLDDKFVIVWDDLVGKMQRSFKSIIKKYHSAYQLQDIYLININGWVGQHENPHTVGLISNFKM